MNVKPIVLSLTTIALLSGQNFSIDDGWQLLGTQQSIDSLESFNDSKIERVWQYKNSIWSAYPSGNDADTLIKIEPNDGFWVKANGSEELTIYGTRKKQTINLTTDFALGGATIDFNVTELGSALRSVWTLNDNNWSRYPHQPEYVHLNVIKKGEGFWIIGNESASVSVTDVSLPKLQELSLIKGWSLKGTELNISSMSIFDTSTISSVWTYKDNIWKRYLTNSETSTLNKIDSGDGFWINTTGTTTIDMDSEASALDRQIVVKAGWQLLGAKENLDITKRFDTSGINIIYVLRDNAWVSFEPTNSTSTLSTINAGEGYWINSSSDQSLVSLIEINGSVVDGYVKDARLSISALDTGRSIPIIVSRSSISVPPETNLTSNTDGSYKFFIEDRKYSGFIISASSGIDKSTGESFEGTMQTLVSPTSSAYRVNSVITPMTTLISNMARNLTSTSGSSSSVRKDIRDASTDSLINQAKEILAQKMGINKNILDKDPINLLQTGSDTDKTDAAKLIKNILVVQKNVELMGKSVVSDAKDAQYKTATNAAMAAIADSITSASTVNSFDDVMKDTTTLIGNTITQLGSTSTISNVSEKLNAVKNVIASSVKTTLRINETKIVQSTDSASILEQIESIQKSVEIVSRKIEEKVASVANASSAFDTAAKGAEDTLKAISISGGIEGVKSLIKKQIDTLAVSGKTVDASDYADVVLSDTKISTQKAQYESVFGVVLNTEIIEAATASFEDILDKQSQGVVLDATTIASIIGEKIALANVQQSDITTITAAAIAVKDTILSDIATLVSDSEIAATTTQTDIDGYTSSSSSSSEDTSSSISSEESSSSVSSIPAIPTIP